MIRPQILAQIVSENLHAPAEARKRFRINKRRRAGLAKLVAFTAIGARERLAAAAIMG
jgi:hypothetical protein